jgi:hypothetical protein
MKKMLNMLLALLIVVSLLLPSSGLAECGCGECAECVCNQAGQFPFPIANSPAHSVSGVYIGVSWWAVSESQLIIGKKAPDEAVPVLPAQIPSENYIRGCGDNGLIREKSAMRILCGADGDVYGLKSLQVSVQIRQEYLALVEGIVHQRLDEYAEMNAANLIACTQWWAGETVCHIFFTSASAKIAVGAVTVNNGQDVIILYAGDFNGDGALELGFAAGWNVPDPVPAPAPEKAPEAPCAGKTPCQKKCGKGYVNIQINILSIVKNCVKFICQ